MIDEHEALVRESELAEADEMYDERNPPPIDDCDRICDDLDHRRASIKHKQLDATHVTYGGRRYADGIPEHPKWWDGSGDAEYRLDGEYPKDPELINALKADPRWMYAPRPYYQWYGRGAPLLQGSKVCVGGHVVGVHRHDESETWESIGEDSPSDYNEFDDPYQGPFGW